MLRITAIASLFVAMCAGTWADQPRPPVDLHVDGYQVLAVDLHTHSSLWSDGALTPWGLVLEARRHGLDAVAVTGHLEILDSLVARRFAELAGGPTILAGEEIISPSHHIIAVGIQKTVSVRLTAAEAIRRIHEQGGAAIAAHPIEKFWPGYDTGAMADLDGTERCHPLVFSDPRAAADLDAFAAHVRASDIGSSDFHGLGVMGACRTLVLAADRSGASILDAIRHRRTLALGIDGRMSGDSRLMRAVEQSQRMADLLKAERSRGARLDWVSRVAGIVGLICTAVLDGRRIAYRDTSCPRP